MKNPSSARIEKSNKDTQLLMAFAKHVPEEKQKHTCKTVYYNKTVGNTYVICAFSNSLKCHHEYKEQPSAVKSLFITFNCVLFMLIIVT